MDKHPYRMDGLVVLPDHLHCIWRLPANDANFSTRWNMLRCNGDWTLDKLRSERARARGRARARPSSEQS